MEKYKISQIFSEYFHSNNNSCNDQFSTNVIPDLIIKRCERREIRAIIRSRLQIISPPFVVFQINGKLYKVPFVDIPPAEEFAN